MQRQLPIISPADLAYLKHAFSDLPNFQSENTLDPIDPLNYCGFGNESCLHIAAFRGDLKAINLLINADLDINAKGDMGSTPLHMAYSGKQAEAITLLLSKGANPELRDEFGRLPKECQS
jgi:uncharacterized protein